MEQEEKDYFETFRVALRRYYFTVKTTHAVPEREKGYLEGFIDAAMQLRVFTGGELQELIEEVNHEVFGMSVQERMRRYPHISFSKEEWQQIPTFIRQGKDLGI
ncbi:hypothetical protein ACUUL3_16765 [Thiovibrio sp. JS02]